MEGVCCRIVKDEVVHQSLIGRVLHTSLFNLLSAVRVKAEVRRDEVLLGRVRQVPVSARRIILSSRSVMSEILGRSVLGIRSQLQCL